MDDHILEELQKARRLVVSLAKEVDVKNEKLFRMESKLDETFCMMMEEKAKLQQVQRAYSQEMKRAQFVAEQNAKLQQRVKELEKREAQIDLERKSLLIEREKGLQDIWNDQDLFGIKRMGEVDEKPFKGVCLKKFPNDWEVNAAELISLWQANVSNPIWHPFKTEFVDGKLQEVIDKGDSKLKELRSVWGEEVYKAVADALLELNDYNSSGRYVVPELWNFNERRKASLKEVIKYMIEELKTLKSYIPPELWNFNEGRKASLKEVIKSMIEELKTLKPLKRRR